MFQHMIADNIIELLIAEREVLPIRMHESLMLVEFDIAAPVVIVLNKFINYQVRPRVRVVPSSNFHYSVRAPDGKIEP